MDDNIRNRLRGSVQRTPPPTSYGRQLRPPNKPEAVQPTPVESDEPTDWQTAILGKPNDSSKPVGKKKKRPKKQRAKLFKRPKKRPKKSKKSKKKILFLFLLLIVLFAVGTVIYSFRKGSKSDQQFEQQIVSTQNSGTSATPKLTGTIRLIAVGDSMAFESINNAAKQPDGSYDYLPMMVGLKPFFEKSDMRLCNETTPGGGDKDGLAISAYPAFNAPLEWSKGFAGLGCNVIDLASANINDKGQPAIDATLGAWDGTANILAVAGANKSPEDQAKIRYFTVKGLKFAYLAYTTASQNNQLNGFGVNIYNDEFANKQIAEAHKNAQLVIVSINWGAKDSNDINPEQDKIAQNLANQNVDVVIGSGPGVVQPAKVLTGTSGHQSLVWFSLGNFLGSQLLVNNLVGGMAVMDFDAGTQQLKDPKLMPLYMHYEWTAAQKASNQVNARHDFMLYPLDLAAPALAKSQNNTTVEAQTARITGIITKLAPIKVIKSTEF